MHPFRPSNSPSLEGLRGALFTLLAVLLLTAGTWGAAKLAGAEFIPIFWDSAFLLGAATVFLVILGLIWDGTLIIAGFGSWLAKLSSGETPNLGVLTRRWLDYGFFSIGLWPILLILIVCYGVLGTSNITLISLDLLDQGATQWRDAFFWRIEAPLLQFASSHPFATHFFDQLYVHCWPLQLIAFMLVILISRKTEVPVALCVSYVLLFYLGRWLGLINPVLGPALYQPELYGYLDGTLTEMQMGWIHKLLAKDSELISKSGILLGGISAIPSLHVAMVALVSYWASVVMPRLCWIGVLWTLATWIMTVMLGWHYALDGLGGLILAACCIYLTRCILPRFGFSIPSLHLR